ncbi:olfactory receptor 6B9-like [Dendropsophus ebraccatus]|uniref:olfactory receptor 6B9-like n=1 Tax=Dendropsophus ebraccatus TaxID=150705 RepID=UPI00383231A3
MADLRNGLNITKVSGFTLVGFPLGHQAKVLLFLVFLSVYLLTILSNVIIIYLVKFDQHLHKPMYFFLANFSFLEIWYISVTVPKMLSDFLDEGKKISMVGCLTQFYFFFFFGSMENFLLVIMSFDRYLAICYPLQYLIIMTERFCILLAVGAWIVSVIAMMIVIIPVSQLSFCGSNEIDHVFCDFSPLVKLSCNSTKVSETIFFFLAGVVIIGCFGLIMASYVQIIITVVTTSSTSGLRSALTTCTSHFTVVFIYYGTVMFMYMRPSAAITFNVDKVVSVCYAVLTPLLNPIIYSLRNKDVKHAMQRSTRNSIESFNTIRKQPKSHSLKGHGLLKKP